MRERLDPVEQVLLARPGVGGHREIVLVRDLLRPCHRVQVAVLAAVADDGDRHLGVRRAVHVLTGLRGERAAEGVLGLFDHRDRRVDVGDVGDGRDVDAAAIRLEGRKRVAHRAGRRCEVRHRVDRLQRSAQTAGGDQCFPAELAVQARDVVRDLRGDLGRVLLVVARDEDAILGERELRCGDEDPLLDAGVALGRLAAPRGRDLVGLRERLAIHDRAAADFLQSGGRDERCALRRDLRHPLPCGGGRAAERGLAGRRRRGGRGNDFLLLCHDYLFLGLFGLF